MNHVMVKLIERILSKKKKLIVLFTCKKVFWNIVKPSKAPLKEETLPQSLLRKQDGEKVKNEKNSSEKKVAKRKQNYDLPIKKEKKS